MAWGFIDFASSAAVKRVVKPASYSKTAEIRLCATVCQFYGTKNIEQRDFEVNTTKYIMDLGNTSVVFANKR